MATQLYLENIICIGGSKEWRPSLAEQILKFHGHPEQLCKIDLREEGSQGAFCFGSTTLAVEVCANNILQSNERIDEICHRIILLLYHNNAMLALSSRTSPHWERTSGNNVLRIIK